MEEVFNKRRGRRHPVSFLKDIEDALHQQSQKRIEDKEDVVLWKGKTGSYQPFFSTRDTWNHTRTTSNKVAWHKGVWFTHATPKFSFCTWLAMHNRLSTGDRMEKWNTSSSPNCVLCPNSFENRDHLFFSCSYSTQVWKSIAKNLFKANFSTDWHSIVDYVSNTQTDRLQSFLARYTFQASIYAIWRERNAREHGEEPTPAARLLRRIDKQIRNQLSTIRMDGDHRYDLDLQVWFETRS